MNTLFKKVYLLTGVVMAANMFIVNEMKAAEMENNMSAPPTTNTNPEFNIQNKENLQEKDKNTKQKIEIKNSFYIGPGKYVGCLLQWENTINLIGGALFTFANGLYNFYENKPSFYFDWLFAGWNSNPFAKGYLQFCPNINLGRGIFWLIMYYAQAKIMRTFCNIIKDNLVNKGVEEKYAKKFANDYCYCLFGEYTPFVIGNKLVGNMQCDDTKKYKNYVFIRISLRLLQNFVSVPLIIHLTSEFTISIAFDSIMWMVVTHFVIDDQLKNTMEYMKTKTFTWGKNNE